MNLTPELNYMKEEIEGYAKAYGLDFFQTIFEMVDYDQMNQVAAYGGFPTRYPHWRFGMDYERMSKAYAYGIQKIYEMVINNDPSYAYLLEGNETVDQKMVIAHVYAHVDFFKNNMWFAQTNRKMVDEMANHASKIRRYIDRYGLDEVEGFLDVCFSLENLIDRHMPFIRRCEDSPQAPSSPTFPSADPKEEGEEEKAVELPLIKNKREYMQSFINPDDFVRDQTKRMQEDSQRKEERFPGEGTKDVLYFLMEQAPLKPWQLDILGIIREEAYYYAPQGQTKILNEGWATYWHSKIMTEKALKDSELIDYASHHAGTVATSQANVNPYKLGVELLRSIEDRWNKGKFGKDYDECDQFDAKVDWDRQLGHGRDKLFQVRRCYNDVTLLDEFLTPEFCIEQKLFTFGFNSRAESWEIISRKFDEVKKKLLMQITNLGQPHIRVEDGNYRNRGELLLNHQHEGIDLRQDYARDTLINLQKIWRRPVHIKTVVNKKPMVIGWDGKDFEDRKLD